MVVGESNRPYSASIAAGAMHAVFCEIEETFHHNERDKDIFNAALESRSLWRAFLERFGLNGAVTADSTIMYRRKRGTQFEEANFETACEIANLHKCLEQVSSATLNAVFQGNLKSSDVIAKTFKNEFAIDAGYLFQQMDILMDKMEIVHLDARVNKINPVNDGVEITMHNGDVIHAERLVLAAGTVSQSLLPSDFPQIPIFHAVGTAFVLNSAPETYLNINQVVRSPNRGGAQCGMHIVPRNGGKYYLGAGNYLSKDMPAHRIETIRYLIDICENELFGKKTIYQAKTELLLGSRPKSIDGYPVVGTYTRHPAIFVATGMYRIGLTIAPLVSSEIERWFNKQEPSSYFAKCSPERALHSYAPLGVAVKYYSESRVSNLVEHGLMNTQDVVALEDKKSELEMCSRNHNADIVNKYAYPNDFVVDPDLYSILLSGKE